MKTNLYSFYYCLTSFIYIVMITNVVSILSEEDKQTFLSEMKMGEECYNNKTYKFTEKDKEEQRHQSPKEYFKYLVKNPNCEGNKELCIESAAFGIKSYYKQLCSNNTSSLNDLKTKILSNDFFKLLETGEECYSKLGEFQNYVKNPATNYNACFKKCIDEKNLTTIDYCNDNCYENSIINIFKVCELYEAKDNDNEL